MTEYYFVFSRKFLFQDSLNALVDITSSVAGFSIALWPY
jgi:hypothetical protein